MRICPKCGARFLRDEPFCPQDGSQTDVATEVLQDDDLVGATLGNYVVQELLGTGGMGKVYRAEHTLLGRQVALKLLHGELSRRPELVQRFFNEARAVNQIQHENIIDVTDFGTTPDGTSYFVMELLKEGSSLDDALRRTKVLEEKRAVRIAVQIADALAAAHSEGIIHRDLKPANVHLIRRSHTADFVKLLDFGIAKLLDTGTGGTGGTTKTGVVIGTPTYMSPEQASGHDVDERTDIYSFGIILYRMVCGDVPFRAKNFPGMLRMHMSEPPPPLRQRNPEVTPQLEALVLRCLAKRPDDRYQTMSEVAGQLRAIFGLPAPSGERRVPADMDSGLEDAPTLAPPDEDSPTTMRSAVGEVSTPRRSRWPFVVGGLAVGIAAAIGFAWVATQEPERGSDDGVAAAEVEETEARLLTDPAGATVFEGEKELGETPLNVDTDRDRKIVLRLDGYRTTSVLLAAGASRKMAVVLDPMPADGSGDPEDIVEVDVEILDVDPTLEDPVALEELKGADGKKGKKTPRDGVDRPVKKPKSPRTATPATGPTTAKKPDRESPFDLHE